MPRETLYEESAKSAFEKKESRIYMTLQVIGWIAVIISMLLSALFLTLMLPQIIGKYNAGGLNGKGLAINLALWIGICALLWLGTFFVFRFRNHFNVSYDYLFVEDELRLTRVFNGRRRKKIAVVRMDQIQQIGYCDKDSYERTVASLQGAKPKILSPNREAQEEKMFIYILVSDNLGKIVYVLECRQKLLECIVMAAGRNKFTRE